MRQFCPMGCTGKSPKHVLVLPSEQFQEVLHPIKDPAPLVSALLQSVKKCISPQRSGFVISYSYGQQICQWSYGGPASFKLFTPCGPTKDLCYECKELLRACEKEPPLLILLKNSVETYADTAAFAKAGQAPSVPLQLLSAGESLGLLTASQEIFAPDRGLSSLPLRPQSVFTTAGARSVHLTVPLNDEDLALRILSLPGALQSNKQIGSQDLAFEQDHWVPLRVLSSVLEQSKNNENGWRTEILVIPQRVLKTLLKEDPGFQAELLKAAFADGLFRLRSSQTSSQMTSLAYTEVSNVEALAHIHEVSQIIANQRLGFGPAENDLLGPFSAIQKLIYDTGVMKTPTLKGRMPAIIVPKTFHLKNPQPDFFYYSLRRPTIEISRRPPDRPFGIMKKIDDALRVIAPGSTVTFFASDLDPDKPLAKPAIPVHTVTRNDCLIKDFCKQLEFAESNFGFDRRTAFVKSRSGFFGHFIRVSNKAASLFSKSLSPQSLEVGRSRPSPKTA